MRLRVKAVQEFDQMYYEPEYKAKCHKRVWKRLGRYIFGISYQSYLDYLKMDVSDIPFPSSITWMQVFPASVTSTSICCAPASMAFSTNSFITDAGRCITSPAAI